MPAKGRELYLNEYLFCTWQHNHADEPTEFYWEVSQDRAVLRLVEKFRDGRLERDTLDDLKRREPIYRGDSLHDAAMPSLGEIEVEEAHQAGSERTETVSITAEQFEAIFGNAFPKI